MIHFIRLLLVHSFLFIVIKAENATYSNTFDGDITQKTGRLKRAPDDDYIPSEILAGMIRDGNDIIHIEWKVVERHLWNENVPVYSVHLDPWGPTHYPRPQVMKDIGKLVIYHSTTHKSVLIYAEKYDRLYGIVDTRYYIMGALIDQLSQPLEIDGRLVRRFPPVFHEMIDDGEIITQQVKKRRLNADSDMAFKDFYIEILVFITHDIYKFMNTRVDNIYFRVMLFNYLIHFYALDMLFAELPTNDFKIYLNLAGFIIEADDGAFSKITGNLNLKFNDNEDIDTNQLIESFKRYPNCPDFPFTKDSYDLIYLSTSRRLMTPSEIVPSLHSSVRDIFAERLNNYGRSFVPMAVVQTPNPYQKYVVSVHEIARSFGIKMTDPENKCRTTDGKQCYGIMQSSKVYCPECITWSDESINQLKSFLKYHRNRCFLINKPRSLLPPGTSLPSLSPCTQCQCFGYGCYDSNGERDPNYCTLHIPLNSCNESLSCMVKTGNDLNPMILPLDGTLCGSNKVCWNEKCVDLPTSPGSK